MTQTTFEKLSAQVDDFCGTTGVTFIFEEKTRELITELLKGVYEDPEHKADYLALFERIRISCDCSYGLLSATIGTIGYNLYDKNAPKLAESSFRIAVEIYSETSARINLAYVCRHHKDELSPSDIEIIDLLFDGVKQREPFSLINMALHFAQNLGQEADWRLADRMISLIKSNEESTDSAVEWWSKLAEEDDDEGILVLCWLERHGKYTVSDQLREKSTGLRQKCSQIPKWIFEPKKKQ